MVDLDYSYSGIEIKRGAINARSWTLLDPEVLEILKEAYRIFEPERQKLLEERKQRQKQYDLGQLPSYFEKKWANHSDWQVAPLPKDVLDRRVEITGPVNNTKMVINMLNGNAETGIADMAMLDFEDSLNPTWANIIDGLYNVIGAVDGTLSYTQAATQEVPEKIYSLNPGKRAHVMVRVRGLHLNENHILIGGHPICAGLFDFILSVYHTAKISLAKQQTPMFYIPKCEHYLEARWWNKVFKWTESRMKLPRACLRMTFLIETLPAAFQMEEILFETKERVLGLNGGRWDKIFSDIKVLKNHKNRILADRATIDMTRPWMANYAKLLINTCHKHGAFAMGGMSAFTPGKEESTRRIQSEKVREDKAREATLGHDGCWVSHPYFIGIARDQFKKNNQLEHIQTDFSDQPDLIPTSDGPKTIVGLRTNIRVGIAYQKEWDEGIGCISLDNLMEDLATLEISRAQIWQWLHHKVHLDNGNVVTKELVQEIFEQETDRLISEQEGFLTGNRYKISETYHAAKERAQSVFLMPQLADFYSEALALNEKAPQLDNMKDLEILESDLGSEVESKLKPDSYADSFADADFVAQFKSHRWAGIKRNYTNADVQKLRGSFVVKHTLAEEGSNRLWQLLHQKEAVRALGALTGNQAMQQVRAGLSAIYLSGWQVAADANLSGQMYPDQSLYPANSVPSVVKKINQTLIRADQISHSEGQKNIHWMAPIVADAEAGFGGALNSFELMKAMIEAGAAGVHFEDQLASEKKCGHLGGKVLVPTSHFIKTLTAARLAADVLGVQTVLIARTDADSARLITSDVDPYDHKFLTQHRTSEGFFTYKGGIEAAISRGLAYAPYADLIWCETSTPDLEEAKIFAEGIRSKYPNKLLAYNCSPSFNWSKKLDTHTISKFQNELNAMGYKFQFVTLAGFHSLNESMFSLAKEYSKTGMLAYSNFQNNEFALEKEGYTATKHQREVGTGYFDLVSSVISGGHSSTLAMGASTERSQFENIQNPLKLSETHC